MPDPQDAGLATTSFIPFRPLTISEMFGGAGKIVVKHWPSLVGIPVALLIAAAAAGAALGLIAGQVLMSSLTASDNLDSFFTGMIAMYVVVGILVYVLAFPLDALLIALSVIATNKAVRGEVIRAGEVFQIARRRMLAVCRLTLFYYTIFIVSDVVVYGLVLVALFASPSAGMGVMLLLFAANFVVGILFSLAPVVLVIEGRGVMDSLKRSLQLTKSAWGRLLAIHLLWMVGVGAVLMLPGFAWFALGPVGFIAVMVAAFGALIAWFRTMQVLIYTDLRMRQENYEQELLADWSRNTATH